MGTIHIQKIQHSPPKRKKLAPWVHVGSTEFQKDRDHEKSGHGLDLEWNILFQWEQVLGKNI
jgi:hypothetical protein